MPEDAPRPAQAAIRTDLGAIFVSLVDNREVPSSPRHSLAPELGKPMQQPRHLRPPELSAWTSTSPRP
jgi:hypothetical protein